MKKLSIFLFSIFTIYLSSCGNGETEVVDMNSENVEIDKPLKEINLFEGARLHIAHVGQDLDNKVYFYKESCDFKPYAIDVVSSESVAQSWDLIIHSETLDKRYLLDGFSDTEKGLSLTLKDGDKNISGALNFTSTENVYAFYMKGLNDSLFVFFEEHVNGFDIMGCADAKSLMESLADKWVPVTEKNGEWEVFEECRYGSGYVYIDENIVEFSGGGDAQSYDVTEVNKEYGNVFIWCKNLDNELEIMIEGADGLIAKFVKNDETSYYVAQENVSKVKVVKEEPCDE